jgi:hypothetical protein
MASYKYLNLTSAHVDGSAEEPASANIRILTLKPGAGNDAMHCSLRTEKLANVTDNQTYETLSYCWGAEDATMSIFLDDGQSETTIFPVRPNIYAALCALRIKDRPRNVWIDAISINQANSAEKSHQVSLMRRIYEGAIRTLIWLGKGTKDGKPAIDLVRSLKNARVRCGNVMPKFAVFGNDAAQHNLPSIFSKDYVRLLTMLEQPWFGRAWVVQEVAVSNKARLYWGSEHVDWDDLEMGIDFALTTQMPFAAHPAVSRVVDIAEEALRYRNGLCRLLPSLLRHRSCLATLPVDKVYAFLGLTEKNPENFIPIEVDYEQDLITAYIHVARRIVEHDRSLDMLSLPATSLETEIVGLPSWVPDWSVSTGWVPHGSVSTGTVLRRSTGAQTISLVNTEEDGACVSNPFCAAGSTSFFPRNDPSSKVLMVEGHRFDNATAAHAALNGVYLAGSITEVGRTAAGVFRSLNVLTQWEDLVGLRSAESLSKKYVNGEDLVDAFFQTLMMGNISPTENKQDLRKEYLAWSKSHRPAPLLQKFKLEFLQAPISAARILTNSVIRKPTQTSFASRVPRTVCRRLIFTEGGYIGLASGNVQIGDQIWLLKGLRTPIVLRAKGGEDGWRVVGDAYVHGIMYGEGFDGEKCELIALY